MNVGRIYSLKNHAHLILNECVAAFIAASLQIIAQKIAYAARNNFGHFIHHAQTRGRKQGVIEGGFFGHRPHLRNIAYARKIFCRAAARFKPERKNFYKPDVVGVSHGGIDGDNFAAGM